MKYIRKFETSEEYNEALGVGIPTPNVCYVEESKGVSYNPYVPSPYDIILDSNGNLKVTLEIAGGDGTQGSSEGAALHQYMTENFYDTSPWGDLYWIPKEGDEFRINGTGMDGITVNNAKVTDAVRYNSSPLWNLDYEGKGAFDACQLLSNGAIRLWEDD